MADGDGVHAAFSVFVFKLCSVLRFAVGGAPDQILIEKFENAAFGVRRSRSTRALHGMRSPFFSNSPM